MALPALILAANPMQEPHITGTPAAVAHMAYRVEPGPRLMRLSQKMPGKGGLLYAALGPEAVGRQTNYFLQQLGRECAAQGYRGAVIDLSPGLGGLAGALDGFLSQRKLTLYLPERYHAQAPKARLLLSTAISGGSLRQHLEEAVKAYGPERLVPAIERSAEDFTMPARNGAGKPLSQEELTALRQKLRPSLFWSPELCARYFTYFEPGGRAHFVLFDDAETLRAKLRLAGELGIRECLAAWADFHS